MTDYRAAVDGTPARIPLESLVPRHRPAENAQRVKSIVESASIHLSGSGQPTLLEVGCASGYMAYLFSELGFRTSAIDANEETKRDEMFARKGINVHENKSQRVLPLADFPDRSMDVVVMGEVFEHILNHPAGLLQAVSTAFSVPAARSSSRRRIRSTLANSVRLLGDGYVLWYSPCFCATSKWRANTVIDCGDIHYREYPAWDRARSVDRVGVSRRQRAVLPRGNCAHPLAPQESRQAAARRVRAFEDTPLRAVGTSSQPENPNEVRGVLSALRARLWHMRDRISDRFRRSYRASVFTRIYQQNFMGAKEVPSRARISIRSDGADHGTTAGALAVLRYQVAGGCAVRRLPLMSRIAPMLDRYTGIDIVETLIETKPRQRSLARVQMRGPHTRCAAESRCDSLP